MSLERDLSVSVSLLSAEERNYLAADLLCAGARIAVQEAAAELQRLVFVTTTGLGRGAALPTEDECLAATDRLELAMATLTSAENEARERFRRARAAKTFGGDR